MSVKVFDVGDLPVVTATFKNTLDTLADPTTLSVNVLYPDGTTGSYTQADTDVIANTSTGVWTFTFPAALADTGPHEVQFTGDSGLVASGVIKFRVRENSFD